MRCNGLAIVATLARIDTSQNRVVFCGHRVLLAIAAVQPNFTNTIFEVAGLVDPTIVIPVGVTVTLDLVNMDYGQDMEHGVVLSTVAPPYPVLGMMRMVDSFAEVGILSPRIAENPRSSAYEEGSVTFQEPAPGVYYYVCQYYDHASKGMFGRLIVQAD